jgi:penicillin-binding protein-related factor A (putative recombinase)
VRESDHDADAAVAAGHKAQAVGALFESGVNRYHEELFAMNLAIIAHTGPPVAWSGEGQIKVIGDAPPDYMGFLARGLPVLFDAKTTANVNQVTLKDKDAGHQLAWMQNTYKITGGKAVIGFYFWWREKGEYVFHPVNSTSGLVFCREEGVSCGDSIAWYEPVLAYYQSM